MEKFVFERLSIPDVISIIPKKFGDERGYFLETYAAEPYRKAGIEAHFVQDNQSLSVPTGTLRGLHFQAPPFAQSKLVRVLAGAVFDVAVDIRPDSPTYGTWCAATLTADGGEQLFIPRGFAHGFCTLAPDTIVTYKVDGYYDAASEGGILWNSPALAIKWPLGTAQPVLSPKDRDLPDFIDLISPFERSSSRARASYG